jgi:hypothetical protein
VDGVIGDAELDWADDRKLRFIARTSSMLCRRPTLRS